MIKSKFNFELKYIKIPFIYFLQYLSYNCSMEKLVSLVKKIKDKDKKINYGKMIFYLSPGLIGTIFSILDLHFNIFSNVIAASIIISTITIMIFVSMVLSHLKGLTKGGIEFIILLVPTLVWLLPEHQIVIDVLTYSTIALFILAIGILIWGFIYLNMESNYRRAVIKSSTIFRISFLFVALINSLAITFLTIDWGTEVVGQWWNQPNAKMPTDWVFIIMGITFLIVLTIIFISAADIFINESRKEKMEEDIEDWQEKTQHHNINKIKKKRTINTKKGTK